MKPNAPDTHHLPPPPPPPLPSFEFSRHSRAGAARKPSVAGESVSTRQLSERLGNARADAGLRHPTEALGRRVQGEEEAVQRAHKHCGARTRYLHGWFRPHGNPRDWSPPPELCGGGRAGGSGGGILMTRGGGAGRGTGEKTSERAGRGSPLNVCREKDQRRSTLGSVCEATPATLRAFADENIPFVWPLCCSSWAG